MYNPLRAEMHLIFQKGMIMLFIEQIVTIFRANCNHNKVYCFCLLIMVQPMGNTRDAFW